MARDYQELVSLMQNAGTLQSPHLIQAFQAVRRKDFLPPDQQQYEAEDQPLPIGHGQTNSQPSTVAFTLELLQPKQEERILDVGSGSGWTTALMAHVVGAGGRVYGVEVVPELVEFGRRNLEQSEYSNAEITAAGEELGRADRAPFDKILVSASAQEIPQPLVEQLAIGGRMVASVRNSLVRVDKTEDNDVDLEEFPGFAFVPLQQ